MQVTLLSRDGELWKVTGGLKSYCNDTWIFGSGTETERERERDACEKKLPKKTLCHDWGAWTSAHNCALYKEPSECLPVVIFLRWRVLLRNINPPANIPNACMVSAVAFQKPRSPSFFFFSVFITGRIGRDGKTQPIWRLATSWTVRCSNTGGSKRVSALYTLLKQLWVPSNFLFNGYQRTALGVNRQACGFGHPPPSSAEVMNEWSCVVGSKSFRPDIRSRAKWKMLWGIYSAIYGEVNVSVGKCVEIKGDYVEK